MKLLLPALLLASGLLLAQEREREVPDDSLRITIPGCVDGRTFTIASREDHEPASDELRPGRRFRLSGPRDVLRRIEAREGQMLELTGLVRKLDMAPEGGWTFGGGRFRVGVAQPQAPLGGGGTATTPQGRTDPVLDVEGWTALPENCR